MNQVDEEVDVLYISLIYGFVSVGSRSKLNSRMVVALGDDVRTWHRTR